MGMDKSLQALAYTSSEIICTFAHLHICTFGEDGG